MDKSIAFKEAIASIKLMSKEQFERLGRKAYKEKITPKMQELIYIELCSRKEQFLADNGFDALAVKKQIRAELYGDL